MSSPAPQGAEFAFSHLQTAFRSSKFVPCTRSQLSVQLPAALNCFMGNYRSVRHASPDTSDVLSQGGHTLQLFSDYSAVQRPLKSRTRRGHLVPGRTVADFSRHRRPLPAVWIALRKNRHGQHLSLVYPGVLHAAYGRTRTSAAEGNRRSP